MREMSSLYSGEGGMGLHPAQLHANKGRLFEKREGVWEAPLLLFLTLRYAH